MILDFFRDLFLPRFFFGWIWIWVDGGIGLGWTGSSTAFCFLFMIDLHAMKVGDTYNTSD